MALLMQQAGLSEVEISEGELSIRLFNPLISAPPVSEAHPPGPETVTSPAIGHFRSLASIGFEPPTSGVYAPGELLGVIGLGPLYRPVCAPFAARLWRSCVADAALVDFGTPLFELERVMQADSSANS